MQKPSVIQTEGFCIDKVNALQNNDKAPDRDGQGLRLSNSFAKMH